MSVYLRLTAMAAAGVLVAAPAWAQPQGQNGPQQQDVAAALHLAPGQQGAYRAVLQAQRPSPDDLSAFRGASGQALASLRTPQRLDRLLAAEEANLQRFRRVADATRAFYGQLSPEQQRTFDQLSAPPPGRGSGGGPQ